LPPSRICSGLNPLYDGTSPVAPFFPKPDDSFFLERFSRSGEAPPNPYGGPVPLSHIQRLLPLPFFVFPNWPTFSSGRLASADHRIEQFADWIVASFFFTCFHFFFPRAGQDHVLLFRLGSYPGLGRSVLEALETGNTFPSLSSSLFFRALQVPPAVFTAPISLRLHQAVFVRSFRRKVRLTIICAQTVLSLPPLRFWTPGRWLGPP